MAQEMQVERVVIKKPTTHKRESEMSAHTLGPWVADEYEVRELATGLRVASVGPNYEANARLIAAAPRMLEALRLLVRTYDEPSALWDEARAILRDVEGESNG